MTVPPFQDLATLARNICAGQSTIERWVKQGKFPAPRKQGGKRLWVWSEVERHLDRTRNPRQADADLIARIKHGTKQAATQTSYGGNVRRCDSPIHGVEQVSGARGQDTDNVHALAQDRRVAGKPRDDHG